MSGAPTVEAEDELIEIGLEVLAAQPVIDAQCPDLEVGEDPVNPGQDDMGGHLADDMGIVGDAGSAGSRTSIIGLLPLSCEGLTAWEVLRQLRATGAACAIL